MIPYICYFDGAMLSFVIEHEGWDIYIYSDMGHNNNFLNVYRSN